MSTLKISGTVSDSIVDGPGLRYTVFTQGCPHHCEGCHNPGTHDFNGGKDIDTQEILKQIFANPLLDGVTFSGGEPFCQPLPLCEIAKEIKAKGLNVVTYTGYTFEELLALKRDGVKELLKLSDVLIDGRFVLKRRKLALYMRGSENQRIINVSRSLAEGKAIEYTLNEYGELV
ncbi:MAG: anaerobic ribonucleoside-triphosphate reductase activating protein [Bacillota bacterium]|nr:anaerobic ribonucleoside-triphosphate reductase activating protein [Bacillota bacterium]